MQHTRRGGRIPAQQALCNRAAQWSSSTGLKMSTQTQKHFASDDFIGIQPSSHTELWFLEEHRDCHIPVNIGCTKKRSATALHKLSLSFLIDCKDMVRSMLPPTHNNFSGIKTASIVNKFS